MKVQGFQLGEVMIHDVPQGGGGELPTLTSAPTPLDDQLRTYFQRKVIDSLSSRGVDVVAAPDEDATVREVVARATANSAVFPVESGRIAVRMSEAQTGVNPAGLLVVSRGTISGEQVVALLKLEREEGVRFQVLHNSGVTTVSLELLRDLTLTKKTRVFKTAILRVDDPKDVMTMSGVASDNQRGQVDGRGVATYFLERVLGCKLAQNPAHATQRFARVTQDWINGGSLSAERRGRYQVALLAELQSQAMDVKPTQFAAKAFESADRHAYLDALREQEIDPQRGFEKDTSLTRMSGFKLTFSSGMTLVGSTEDLNERVEMAPNESRIKDTVKEIRGK